MTQKYFELLEVCKQISPEVKERIEELKFGCFVKVGDKLSIIYNKYDALLNRSPTTPYKEKSIWKIEHSIGKGYSLEVFDKQKSGDKYKILNKIDLFEILGSLTIAGFVELLGDDYCLFRNGISEIRYSENSEDARFYRLKVSFEPGKELHEQSEETLQKCIDLIDDLYFKN